MVFTSHGPDQELLHPALEPIKPRKGIAYVLGRKGVRCGGLLPPWPSTMPATWARNTLWSDLTRFQASILVPRAICHAHVRSTSQAPTATAADMPVTILEELAFQSSAATTTMPQILPIRFRTNFSTQHIDKSLEPTRLNIYCIAAFANSNLQLSKFTHALNSNRVPCLSSAVLLALARQLRDLRRVVHASSFRPSFRVERHHHAIQHAFTLR